MELSIIILHVLGKLWHKMLWDFRIFMETYLKLDYTWYIGLWHYLTSCGLLKPHESLTLLRKSKDRPKTIDFINLNGLALPNKIV